MRVIAIDTANKPLSVAISEDDTLLGTVTLNMARTHSQTLMPVVAELLDHTQTKVEDLDRVAVTSGPGSYTGVRIGVTTAKTLAWTMGIPLVTTTSLQLLAGNIPTTDTRLIVSLIDARHMNVYAGGYQWIPEEPEQGPRNVILPRHLALADLLPDVAALRQPTIFVGNIPLEDQALIRAQLGDQASFAGDLASLPQTARLALWAPEMTPIKNIHDFVPTYYRLTQAEQEWGKHHHDEGHTPYVQEV
ncbi:MAG: tRNA (adenosine(37)-N6)-threonylcarbamoyltransferase complex dimerization subunit type 1 TsaB [Schleiferilactobacillus perolens]|uniref:tRNA (adenosine(37)-N6)-threonylcarbamoyltransferase complex dimerization subunit type 1 TsaB n=1 Tax=Schleiferilactobacillus perolens TaxID=100468 RepID=UPI0039EA5A9C